MINCCAVIAITALKMRKSLQQVKLMRIEPIQSTFHKGKVRKVNFTDSGAQLNQHFTLHLLDTVN